MPGDAVDVELVEDDRQGPARRRVPLRGVLALLLVAVLGAGVAFAVGRARELARAAELVELGFAPSLAEPPAPAWSAADAGPLLADRQRVVTASADGLTARDLVDGTVLWRLDLDGECVPVVAGQVLVALDVAVTDASARLWCVDAAGRDLAVDPADGRVLGEQQAPGAALLATVLDGDVVRLQLTGDGRVEASRWSLTGTLRWRSTTPDPVAATVLPTVILESGGAYARVVGTRSLLLDLATGAEVDPGLAAAGLTSQRRTVSRSVPIPGGGTVEQRDGPGLLPQVVAVGPDGVQWWQVSGALARPDRDDGSDPDVALVMSGGVLSGRDVRTGERRWSLLDAVRPAVLVDGLLAARGAGEIVGVRVADGAVLWRAPAGRALTGAALASDGRLLVGDDGRDLVAWDLSDGAQRWRSPLPDGALWDLLLPDGALLVGTADRVTVLR